MAQIGPAYFGAPKLDALYYGDNLSILRDYLPDECVDLIYLDPPFNSNRAYNVIFKDESGQDSDAQHVAFEDTWHWGPSAELTYRFLTNSAEHRGRIAPQVSTIVAALLTSLGKNQMMAYLVEMSVRLVELHRVLKPTGSIYLHCDPTASHYLKVVMDAVFGPQRFCNEIIWKRAQTVKGNFGQGSKLWGQNTDTILFYAKSADYTFRQPFQPYSAGYADKSYRHIEEETGRHYQLVSMTGPGGAAKGNPYYEVMGVSRYWRYSRGKMQELIDAGQVVQASPGAVPRRKYYLDEGKGVPVQSLWDDVPALHANDAERLGYPTQKPLSLLERIIAASSEPGDVVLDPFCGCGTAVVAAQKLGRRWMGIDITYLAIAVMKARLNDAFGLADVPVVNEPTEVEGARQLALSANKGRNQFEWWALGQIGAVPRSGARKLGADGGIDGQITFTDHNGELERVLVSVKSGHVERNVIDQLRGVMDREGAAIGVLVTLEDPTRPMVAEAQKAGMYHSALWNRDYPRIQIITVKELLAERKRPDLPAFTMPAYQQAQRARTEPAAVQGNLFQ